MTIPEGLSDAMFSSVNEKTPPPVNNACVPDIFNKLDAGAIERTKVVNTHLTFQLRVQEKVLTKYRNAAEQRFLRERDKVRSDLRNIVRRMPNYADIPHLETKIKKLQNKKRDRTKHDCVFTTEPLDMKGLMTEKEEKPFCDRFFTHHLPTKSRFYKDVLNSVKKGMSMPDLRPRPGDRFRRLVPLQTERHNMAPKIFPVIQSLDDNFVSSRTHLLDDDDDSKTV